MDKDTLQLSVIRTGSASAKRTFVVSGGSLVQSADVAHVVVYIKHSKGSFFFDSGLGSKVDEQCKDNKWFHKIMFAYENVNPAAKQLAEQGINPDNQTIILSHLHWDHASGLPDFPNVTVVTQEVEFTHACNHGKRPAFIQEQFNDKNIKWKFIHWSDENYEGFEKSWDYFGDKTIVFVPLPGHTPGSIGMFVNFSEEDRLFFTGDITWTLEGFQKQKSRPKIASDIVDTDYKQNKLSINKVHELMKRLPNLQIFPAHDGRELKKLPQFPKWKVNP